MKKLLTILIAFFLLLCALPAMAEGTLKAAAEAIQAATTLDEQLAALSGISAEDAAGLEDAQRAAELNVAPAGELPAELIPDVENAEKADGLPDALRDARFIVVRDDFDTDGSLLLMRRTLSGSFLARLPEANRARSLAEADAVLYITESYQKRGDYIGTAYNRVYILYAKALDSGKVWQIAGTATTPPQSGFGVLAGARLAWGSLWKRFEPAILNIPLVVEYPEGTASFRVTDGGCCMIGLEGEFTRFEVPAEVEGRTVVGIEKIKSSDLVELILPEGLEWIEGRNAIECQFLKRIQFPSTLRRITGKDVFWYTPWPGHPLDTLDFNEGLEEIGEDALNGTLNIRSITLPSTLRALGDGFLRYGLGCGWLALPEGLERLPGQFLSYPGYIACVYIPNSVTYIPSNALNKTIRIYSPSGSWAFGWAQEHGYAWFPCESAEDMPKPTIGREGDYDYLVLDGEAELLRYYGSDEKITVPDTLGGAPVRVIHQSAFANFANSNFKYRARELSLPDGVRQLKTPCVSDGQYLEALYIPASVERCDGPIVQKCPACTVFSPADSPVKDICEAAGIAWAEWSR